jgi:hypothetical protein
MMSFILRGSVAHSTAQHRARLRRLGIGAAIVMGGFWFSIPALVNGFPFVFPDSIDYLVFTPRIYRSPFYGLFIFFFHLDRFIWAPVFAQALIVSHLLWVFVRIYGGEPKLGWFALIVLTLGLFSSLPFFTGFIMPDFFTSVMILVFYLLGFQTAALGRGERLYFVLLTCIAISAHISHLPEAIALAFLVVFIHIVLGASLRSSLRQVAILIVPIVLVTCATLLNNFFVHRIFALFPAGQTFVLANMLDQGPARRYLQEVCPGAGFKICGILDSLPARSYEFLWTTDALQRLGGFDGMREEAKEIVAATIRAHPSEVVTMAVRNIGSTFVVHAPGAELTKLRPVNDFWMRQVLEKKFGANAVRAYQTSRQSQDEIPRALLAALDDVVFPTAVVALLVTGLWASRRGITEGISLAFFVTCAVIINNVICAVGSGVNERYQARVTWLVAFSALLIFARLLRAEEVIGTSRRPADLAAAPTVGASDSVASRAQLRSGGALAYGKSEAN